MKYIVYVLVAFLFLTTLKATEKNDDNMIMIAGLQWHSDINSAYTIAAKENKHVLVMVANEYCQWCRKMKEQTFIDKRIKAKLEKYTLVIMKHSDKSVYKHIPVFNGTVPSLFFMNSKRESFDRIVGYFAADDLLKYINDVEELEL